MLLMPLSSHLIDASICLQTEPVFVCQGINTLL